MGSRGKTWRHLALGLVIAAGALFLAYRKTDLSLLLTALGGISWPLLLTVLPLLAVSYLFRILQWRVLLSPIADVSMGDASGPLLTGFMLNSLLPGRVGEVLRALLLSRRTCVPGASSFATVVLARLLDGLTLAGMTLVVLTVLQSRLDDTIRMGLVAAGAMYAVVLVVLVALRKWKDRAAGVISTPFGWLGMKGLGLRVKKLLISFSLGLEVMNSWKRLFLAVLYSLLIWGSLAVSVVPVFAAMHLEVLWYYPLLVLILAGLGMLIPTPAGTGTVHGALVLVMPGLIGIPVETVRVFALLFHTSQFLPIILVGLVAALREGVTPSYIDRLSGDGIEEPPDA
jgi:glycosyltransferase 2 family protein